MDAIRATVKDGRLELRAPSDWPDGTEVLVQPVHRGTGLGVDESTWVGTADAVAEWEAWYDALEPLIFTAEERANWETARRDRERFEATTSAGRADKLRAAWE